MIRSNLPLPFIYRLRFLSGSARRAQSSVVTYRQPREQASGTRTLTARHAAPRRTSGNSGGGADGLWQDFIDEYENFTGVLCAAAKTGCDASKESEYAQMRRWFVANYYRISARIRPYLENEFQGNQEFSSPTVVDYAGQKRTLDALESLFLPATLQDVLRHDTGDLIPRVARVSDAVYRCYADWEAKSAS